MGGGRWSKRLLALYFVLFLLFLYGPIIVMTVLSFQSEQGRLTFPLQGFSLHWWQTLFDTSILGGHAEAIRETGLRSLYLGLAVGAVAALLAFSLSMAFRRRFRVPAQPGHVALLADDRNPAGHLEDGGRDERHLGAPLRLPRDGRRLEPLRQADRGGVARSRRRREDDLP
jgi:hypothetical protein